ncbi:hypothetical protein ACIG0D_01630 [Streptomyces sp. NPDC052773]|uniref:hypothetical protein n=1 Tax=Streptomyces sp. NPDC052773 TaxID=3365693 RepID=UPI0037D33509
MLQDIDLAYDRSGALATSRTLKAPAVVAGGVPLTAPSQPQPADHGLIAWSADPSLAGSTSAAVSGTLYLAAVWIRSAAMISRLWWVHTTAGSGIVAGQCWAGLYDSAGARLASVGVDSEAAANGPRSPAVAPLAVAAGRYWVALLFNATTPPILARTAGASATANNLNLTAASLRYAVNGTGLTALPATINPAANTSTGALSLAVAVS